MHKETLRRISLVAAAICFLSLPVFADVTIWIQHHEGQPFYDAYFVWLQSEGNRAGLLGAFDDVVRSAKT